MKIKVMMKLIKLLSLIHKVWSINMAEQFFINNFICGDILEKNIKKSVYDCYTPIIL